MRDAKCKGFLEGTTNASNWGKFHWYTCKVVIYFKNEYQENSRSTADLLEVVCNRATVCAP